MVTIGNGLRPVFIVILDLINASIPAVVIFGQAFASAAILVKGVASAAFEIVKNLGLGIYKLGEAAVEAVMAIFRQLKQQPKKPPDMLKIPYVHSSGSDQNR